MEQKRWTVLVGGPAGQGPNLVANLLAKALAAKGYYVFASREYESRIRGGHNFNVITFSTKPIATNDSSIDILIALDELAYEMHKKELKKTTEIIREPSSNIYAAGQAFKMLGFDLNTLDEMLKTLGRYEENILEANKAFNNEARTIVVDAPKGKNFRTMNGAEAVALGAIGAGLDVYYAYPMTPSTTLLFELAQRELAGKHITIELESEIAVANAAVGSAIGGMRAMVGTSGGGFDLMSETLSLTGIAKVPVVFYLAQRPGPATGAPTYTAQGDLAIALNAGHGEFPRIVVAPGDPIEAIEKSSELFHLTQKFHVPGILLSDKHLAESVYTLSEIPKITEAAKTITWPGRYSSYNTDKYGSATVEPELIIKDFDNMKDKAKKIAAAVEKYETYSLYGKRGAKTLVVGWGSTKGAIIDAIQGQDCEFLQVKYLEPWSHKITSYINKAKHLIVVENNSTGQLAHLIRAKTRRAIEDKNVILRYDGRPFLGQELKKEISRRIK